MRHLRKAKITKHRDGSGGHTVQVWFHQWGSDPLAKDNGDYAERTVGIVELENGTIKTVEPTRIKFDV
jgi:hypothetical protein